MAELDFMSTSGLLIKVANYTIVPGNVVQPNQIAPPHGRLGGRGPATQDPEIARFNFVKIAKRIRATPRLSFDQ